MQNINWDMMTQFVFPEQLGAVEEVLSVEIKPIWQQIETEDSIRLVGIYHIAAIAKFNPNELPEYSDGTYIEDLEFEENNGYFEYALPLEVDLPRDKVAYDCQPQICINDVSYFVYDGSSCTFKWDVSCQFNETIEGALIQYEQHPPGALEQMPLPEKPELPKDWALQRATVEEPELSEDWALQPVTAEEPEHQEEIKLQQTPPEAPELSKEVAIQQVAQEVEALELSKEVAIQQVAQEVEAPELSKEVAIQQVAQEVEAPELSKEVAIQQVAQEVEAPELSKDAIQQVAQEVEAPELSKEVAIQQVAQEVEAPELSKDAIQQVVQDVEAPDLPKAISLQQSPPETLVYEEQETPLIEVAPSYRDLPEEEKTTFTEEIHFGGHDGIFPEQPNETNQENVSVSTSVEGQPSLETVQHDQTQENYDESTYKIYDSTSIKRVSNLNLNEGTIIDVPNKRNIEESIIEQNTIEKVVESKNQYFPTDTDDFYNELTESYTLLNVSNKIIRE